jgi:hypothetical protein
VELDRSPAAFPTPMDAVLSSCALEPVWFVWAELWAGPDDDRVREAVMASVTLSYGAHYERVCFESGVGTQFYRSRTDAIEDEKAETETYPVRTLTFSLPRHPEVLAAAIEAIRQAHSYEEPVIYVTGGYATRADDRNQRMNPNRFWNRGPGAK